MVDPQLLEGFRAGDRRALARLITLLDNNPDGHRVLDELGPAANRAGVIGVTGAPGVGKSTLLGRLIGAFRARGRRVAVLAVDPQSPISGGALLGDRIRMAEPAARDEDVFIRSLSSRGVAGGLSASVRWITRLLERFGYDIILVETVGVGQGELGVLRVADVVVLMVMPGTGDVVQWEKAGLIEVAHLVVLNKADHKGADSLEQELRDALEPGGGIAGTPARLGGHRPIPTILRTVASEGVGIDAVAEQLTRFLAARPALDWHQARTEIVQEAEMLLGQRLRELSGDAELVELAQAVASGQVELSSAAEQALLRLLPRLISGGVLASPSPFEGQGRAGVDDVRLIEPDVSCRDEFIAYCEEFKAAGEPFAHDQLPDAEADFAGLVRRWFQWSRGINLKPGWVPGSTYWLVRGRRILGTARLRHTLNDDLLKEGGNIGYEVRPTERGKGCATRLLSLMLDKARQLGLARVLLTCVKENIASARVMHKNGGVLEDEIPSRIHPGGTAQRYWIEL